jgi:internalin A
LTAAKVALLLVSPDFIDSDFIANNELPKLLEAASTRGMKILWVAVRESAVEDHYPELAKIQAINTDPNKPLAALDEKEVDPELKKIYTKIKELVKVMR